MFGLRARYICIWVPVSLRCVMARESVRLVAKAEKSIEFDPVGYSTARIATAGPTPIPSKI